MITFAAASVGSRKIRSGRSGCGERCSIRDEPRDQRGRGDEQADRERRAPAVGRRTRERVDEQHQARRDRRRLRQGRSGGAARFARLSRRSTGVSAIAATATGTLMKKIHDQCRYEVSTPPEQHPRRRAAAGRRAVDPERKVALATLGERRHQQRERGGCHQGAPQALKRAKRDQRALRPGEAAQQRGRAEQREPHHEQAPAPEQVCQPPSEQQHPAEEDRVGRDDPLDRRVRESQVGLDRRQRHVDDRDVQDHHELGGDDQRQGAPSGLLQR